jgi:hypothetical protein
MTATRLAIFAIVSAIELVAIGAFITALFLGVTELLGP